MASNYGHTGVVMELLDRGACINLATVRSTIIDCCQLYYSYSCIVNFGTEVVL